jgi:hypothetical protein
MCKKCVKKLNRKLFVKNNQFNDFALQAKKSYKTPVNIGSNERVA